MLKYSIFVSFNFMNRSEEILKVNTIGQTSWTCDQHNDVSMQYIRQIMTIARSSHVDGRFGSDFEVRFSHAIICVKNSVDNCLFVE